MLIEDYFDGFEETDADRAYVPEADCCADCLDERDFVLWDAEVS